MMLKTCVYKQQGVADESLSADIPAGISMKQWLILFVLIASVSALLSSPSSMAQEAESDAPASAPAEAPEARDDRPLDMDSFLDESRTPRFELKLPERLKAETKDAIAAATRISFAFSEDNDSPLQIEFDGEVTQIPVAAALFEAELCDTELSYEKYREREHYVQLGYQVKLRPRVDQLIPILVEHWHMRAAGEQVFVDAFTPSAVEPFVSYSLSLPNALPGLNRYILRIPELDGIQDLRPGDVRADVSDRGVSHFVTVHEVAAMGLKSDVSFAPDAEIQRFGSRLAYRAGVRVTHEFTLNPALDPANITVRVRNRGRRQVGTQNVRSGVRELLGSPTDTVGAFRIVREAKLAELEDPLLMIESLGQQRFRISYMHMIAVTEDLLPFRDTWEYRVELWDSGHSPAVDRFDFHLNAAVLSPDNAKLSYQHSEDIEVEKRFVAKGFTPKPIDEAPTPSDESAE